MDPSLRRVLLPTLTTTFNELQGRSDDTPTSATSATASASATSNPSHSPGVTASLVLSFAVVGVVVIGGFTHRWKRNRLAAQARRDEEQAIDEREEQHQVIRNVNPFAIGRNSSRTTTPTKTTTVDGKQEEAGMSTDSSRSSSSDDGTAFDEKKKDDAYVTTTSLPGPPDDIASACSPKSKPVHLARSHSDVSPTSLAYPPPRQYPQQSATSQGQDRQPSNPQYYHQVDSTAAWSPSHSEYSPTLTDVEGISPRAMPAQLHPVETPMETLPPPPPAVTTPRISFQVPQTQPTDASTTSPPSVRIQIATPPAVEEARTSASRTSIDAEALQHGQQRSSSGRQLSIAPLLFNKKKNKK